MTDILGRTALYLSEFTEVLILAKATIAVSLMLLGVRLARRARASERHVLLAATFAILLLLPALTLLMPTIPVAVSTEAMGGASMSAPSAWSTEPIESNAERAPRSVVDARPSNSFSLATILRTAWAVGALCFVVPVAFALGRLRRTLRCGMPWLKGEQIVRNVARRAGLRRRVDVLLHEGVTVPMTCGIIRPSIVLPFDVESWDTASARRAIVHELEHVRRGDWPIQLAARMVVSLYWFHPLVWNAWRQLCLESERACDDAVLREAEGTDYAEQLVTMAGRFANAEVQPMLSMANRSDLSTRIRAVLDADQQRGKAGGLRVTAAIVAALILALAIGPLRATNTPQSPGEVGPRFEVASVKVNESGDLRVSMSTSPGGRFTARNVPLRVLIRRAYQLQQVQLEGGPKWLDRDRFDVIAQGEASATPEQMRLRLQALLADRFKLELHSEMRDVPLYALVLSRRDGTLGPALRRARPFGPARSQRTVRVFWSRAWRHGGKVPWRYAGNPCAISVGTAAPPGGRSDRSHRVLRRGSRDDGRTWAAATERAGPIRPLVAAVDLHDVTGAAWPQARCPEGANRHLRDRSTRTSGGDWNSCFRCWSGV